MDLWEHSAQELVAMPVEALALLVLADFGEQGWNVDSYFKERAQYPESSQVYRQAGVAAALREAWAWLESNALVGGHSTQDSPNARQITRLGREALRGGLARLLAGRRLGMELHPTLASSVRLQFLMGEFELAAFAALREVEIRVRTLCNFSDEKIGVALMAAAFNPQSGPLTDPGAEGGEREAVMALFRGAIGTFKNPSSHRAVDYDDPTLAAEVVLLADLLLRLLDRIRARLA